MAVTLRSPRQILVGDGAVRTVGRLVAERGRRALVLTDPVMGALPGFAALRASLDAADVELETFTEAVAEVPLEVVEASTNLARRFGPDVIVALGGGSVIDLAKLTGLLLTHGGHPRDYYGEALVPGPITPVVALPTTSGTGSEVTPVAVVADPGRALKVGVSSVHLVPELAVCDPELTLSCPPTVTAHAGIDALCHAVEAYTTPVRETDADQLTTSVAQGKNPLSDALCRPAVVALSQHLARVVESGDDLEARRAVMLAATQAGLAFAHAGVGAPHALQFPVGAATGTPHGLGVGLLLPYVLTANRVLIEPELVELAELVGLEERSAQAFIDWVVDLAARIGIPASLREIGVERSSLHELARLASTIERLLKGNRGDNSVEGLERVLVAAWEGDRGLVT